MNDFERHHALKIKSEIVKSIPDSFCDDWVSVAAWLWLSPSKKGLGGGAQVYDRLGYAGGFTFPVKPLLEPLVSLQSVHSNFDRHVWKTVLLQFGRKADHLHLFYEYDDPYRWAVTEQNYRWMIRQLRPSFA